MGKEQCLESVGVGTSPFHFLIPRSFEVLRAWSKPPLCGALACGDG